MKLIQSIFFILLYVNVVAQNNDSTSVSKFNGDVMSSDWTDHGLTIGVDFHNYLNGEIGYYKSDIWEAGGFPTSSTTMNYGVEFSYNNQLILAPKIQARVHAYFFNASISGIYYTDLGQNSALKLRPEVGVGLWNLDINYGYNIGLFKTGLNNYNKHVFTIRYYIKIFRKHGNEYDINGNKK